MHKFFLSILLIFFCFGNKGECSHSHCCEPLQKTPCQNIETIEGVNEFDYILLLIQKWLAAMHEVARWKIENGIPILEFSLEEGLIENHTNHAINMGIPKNWINFFGSALLNAAKAVQDRDVTEFSGIGKCGERACDYSTELQPYLSEITQQLFEKIGKVYPFLEEYTCSCHFLIQPPLSQRKIDRIPPHAWIKALAPFCACRNKDCHLENHH